MKNDNLTQQIKEQLSPQLQCASPRDSGSGQYYTRSVCIGGKELVHD